jgi:hypothetical protein
VSARANAAAHNRAAPYATNVDNEQALDPTIPDYASQDARPGWWTGFIYGDAREAESIPQLAGQLTSGLLIFGDSRDAVYDLFSARWFDAGIAAVGLVPLAGDEVKAAALASKYIARHPTEAAQAIREVERIVGEGAVKRITGVPEKEGAWLLQPLSRGRVLEDKIAQGIPGDKLLGNFPKIDVFDQLTGKATSIKTIDFDAKTYQNVGNFERKVSQYANDLATLSANLSGKVNGVAYVVRSGDIASRQLIIGVPRTMVTDYAAAIDRVKKAYPNLEILIQVVQ